MIKNVLTGLKSVANPIANSLATMASTKAIKKGGFAAIVQVTCTSDKVSNFNRIKSLIEQAVSNHNASVVFLPEAFDFIGESTSETLELAEPIDGPLINQYRDLAQTLKVSLSLGGFHEAIKNDTGTVSRIKNTHLIIDGDDGTIRAKYSKCHLFDVEIPERNLKLKESDYVIPGSDICKPVSTKIGRIGLGICYDLRFPELSVAMARNGTSIDHAADILTYPSAFTIPTGSAHWEVLLRARAIENQCYVIAAAQTGVHNKKRSSYGHSMIVDPWGSVIAQCSEGESVSSAYIDLEYLEKVRKNMPVWSHRRNDIYGLVLENDIQVPKLEIDGYQNNLASEDQKFGSFCIPKEEIVMVSRHSYATVNLKPVVPFHLLVIPKKDHQKLCNLSCDETADLFNLVKRVQKLVEQFRGVSSSTIALQDGEDAGQTVKHVHVHVLPRQKNDFENNDDIYNELAKHDKEPGRKARTHEEMVKEAQLLRNYILRNADQLLHQ